MIINVKNEAMLGRNNDSVYATIFHSMRKEIDDLQKENKQLKKKLQNISNEILKYNWKTATQEQIYNQLKNLYESILKGDSNE